MKTHWKQPKGAQPGIENVSKGNSTREEVHQIQKEVLHNKPIYNILYNFTLIGGCFCLNFLIQQVQSATVWKITANMHTFVKNSKI